MKLEIINILNGKVMGEESISFTSRTECKDYIKGMVAFVADSKLDIEFDHKAFSINDTRAEEYLVSLLFSRSMAAQHSLTWNDGAVFTICTLVENDTPNIGSWDNNKNND